MDRVLLVDDDPLFREATSALLHANGFAVIEATDGDSAMEIFSRNQDCILLCDIFMLGKEGLETIRDLRKQYPKARIIAMSVGDSRLRMDVFKIALHMGANGTLRKPFTQEELREALDRVAGSSS